MKKDMLYFVIVFSMLAVMDGLVFHWEHNQGFFSLTYGEDRYTILGMSFDAWHTLKRLLILVLYTWIAGIRYKEWKWWFDLVIIAIIASITQVVIYNGLIKLT
jgi:hypothetical protein